MALQNQEIPLEINQDTLFFDNLVSDKLSFKKAG